MNVLDTAAVPIPAAERVRVKRAALARQPLLHGCSATTVRRLAAFTDEVRVSAGDVIVEQGRHGLWFFLIDKGRAEVVRDGRVIEALGPGQHFGEAAVLRRVLQPATVRAVSDMTLFVVGCQRLVPLVRDVRLLRARLGDVMPAPHAAPPMPFMGVERAWKTRAVTSGPPPPLLPPRKRRRWVALSVLGAALAAAAVWHPPLAVIAPGPSIDVSSDITISGAPVTPVNGRYLAPTVRSSQPTLLGLVLSLRHPNRRVVTIDDAQAQGVSRATARRNGLAAFERSQRAGAAAGSVAAGVRATVYLRHRTVTGPSAGLAYALAVEDMLDPVDRAAGRTIVATGEVLPDRRVGPVGYVAQKAATASDAKASVLLVPDEEITDAWGKGVDVKGVGSLAEALQALASAR